MATLNNNETWTGSLFSHYKEKERVTFKRERAAQRQPKMCSHLRNDESGKRITEYDESESNLRWSMWKRKKQVKVMMKFAFSKHEETKIDKKDDSKVM